MDPTAVDADEDSETQICPVWVCVCVCVCVIQWSSVFHPDILSRGGQTRVLEMQGGAASTTRLCGKGQSKSKGGGALGIQRGANAPPPPPYYSQR